MKSHRYVHVYDICYLTEYFWSASCFDLKFGPGSWNIMGNSCRSKHMCSRNSNILLSNSLYLRLETYSPEISVGQPNISQMLRHEASYAGLTLILTISFLYVCLCDQECERHSVLLWLYCWRFFWWYIFYNEESFWHLHYKV